MSHVDAVRRDGFTIIEDAFDAELADRIRADLDRLERELGVVPAGNDFEGARTLRIYNLLVHGELYEQIPVDATILPVVEGVLDPGCLISSLSSIVICPQEKAQPIHADDILIPLPTSCCTRSARAASPRAAFWCGTGRCGTAAAPTARTSGATASR